MSKSQAFRSPFVFTGNGSIAKIYSSDDNQPFYFLHIGERAATVPCICQRQYDTRTKLFRVSEKTRRLSNGIRYQDSCESSSRLIHQELTIAHFSPELNTPPAP